jgi:pyruvate carboxylase
MNEPRRRIVPHAGDIVIYGGASSAGIHLLSAFRHACHLTSRTYDAAICDATTFAATNHVDAWYTVDAQTYRPVAKYRMPPEHLRIAA